MMNVVNVMFTFIVFVNKMALNDAVNMQCVSSYKTQHLNSLLAQLSSSSEGDENKVYTLVVRGRKRYKMLKKINDSLELSAAVPEEEAQHYMEKNKEVKLFCCLLQSFLSITSPSHCIKSAPSQIFTSNTTMFFQEKSQESA